MQLLLHIFLINVFVIVFISDVPTQIPPLTPGTNRKVAEVLKASFASWEKEVQNCNITKGMLRKKRLIIPKNFNLISFK